jgi:hypothetical protein
MVLNNNILRWENLMNKESSYLVVPANKNCIVTIAIGDTYFADWNNFMKKNWTDYCKKFDLGLIVINKDLVDKNSLFWKKPTWQKFLLVEYIRLNYPSIETIAYLDSDIMISPLAPNVFDSHSKGCISLVSLIKNLPYNRNETLDKLAWYRHQGSEGRYPLDSSLFMSTSALYEYHNLPVQKDFACAGFFTADVDKHSKPLMEFFYEVNHDIKTITNNGDQTHFNYFIQSNLKVKWLPYKFQTIWSYEAANYYPSTFYPENASSTFVCIQNALSNCYFLHFAGNWYECQLWKNKDALHPSRLLDSVAKSLTYQKEIKKGDPIGFVKYEVDSKPE